MIRFIKYCIILLWVMVTAFSISSCHDDDDDYGGIVDHAEVHIDELLKNGNPNSEVTASGEGDLLEDYRNIIKDLTGGNDEDDQDELEFYKKKLAELEAYCKHKSDSLKAADPEAYQHALDSLRALDPANSLDAGLGQMFARYGWCTITYMDVGADGKERKMSTLVVYPVNLLGSLTANHVILCPHWTIASDAERPSNFADSGAFRYSNGNANVMAGEWVSYDRCLVILPDYEGYGASKDVPHPYLFREVQARQCIISLLRGIGYYTSNKKYWSVKGHDKKLDKDYKIVIEGYSQGGAVSAATYRYYLEHKNEDWAKDMPIAGAVCGDGPYDPFATLKYYCKTNLVEMPVAAAMVLKGLCDYDPEMKAAKCTLADFCNPALIKSGIFEAIASKNYNTDQCSDFAFNYAKGHPDEMKLRDDGSMPADQMFTPAAYNYFLNGRLIKGANYQKLSLLKKCLEKNSVCYNFTPPSDAHFTFFHSDGDRVVPFDNYTSVKNAWGGSKIYGVTYKGEKKTNHMGVGEIFFKSYHHTYVNNILKDKWESGEKTEN